MYVCVYTTTHLCDLEFGLAAALDKTGSDDRATPLYEECMTHYRRLLGNQHPSTIKCASALATFYKKIGQYVGASSWKTLRQ